MKKTYIPVLILLCMSMLLSSCLSGAKSKNTSADSTNEQTDIVPTETYPISKVTVIRPYQTHHLVISASQRMNSTLSNLTGAKIQIKDDFISQNNQPDPSAYEILIGDTNREESSAAKDKLNDKEFAYYIGREGNKIVIVGTTPEMTVQGVQYFLDTCVANKITDGKLELASDYSYTHNAEATTIINAGSTNYRIVTSVQFQSTGVTDNIKKLNEVIKNITSKSATVTMDTLPETSNRNDDVKEILLGYTYYPQSQNYIKSLNYNEYGVAVDGNKLVIFGFSDSQVKKAIDLFSEIVERYLSADKTLRLPKDMAIRVPDNSLRLDIPYFPASSQKMVSVDAGNMIYATKTNWKTVKNYGKTLLSKGFELYTENNIGRNAFVTYSSKNLTVNIGFDASTSTARIVVENASTLPPRAEDNVYTASTQTQLTQVGLSHIKDDTGMSYFIRLSDGRFIVFDGGSNDVEEHHKLYNLMKEQCENGQNPVVAAWFLTHAHTDHYQAFLTMTSAYAKSLTIENVIYNLPTEELGTVEKNHTTAVHNGIKSIAGANIIRARTGQKYYIGNAVIDVLYTPEDAYPTFIKSINDSSVVYRVICENQTIMILGDIEQFGADVLCKRYGEYLKSDIMQMAHHGYTGGSNELFALIDPEIVLWPCPDHWYHETLTWECNSFIATSQNVKEIINSGHGTTTVQLPYSPQPTTSPSYSVGDVIYHEDFEALQYVYETGWFSVYSLNESRQYTELSLRSENNDRGLLMNGFDNSVLCFLRPDELKNVTAYTVELTLNVKQIGNGFGIWYNDASPINIDERAYYDIKTTGNYVLTLKIDCLAGTTQILLDGEILKTVQNDCNDAGGLHFHSKNAEVFVGEVTVKAGV